MRCYSKLLHKKSCRGRIGYEITWFICADLNLPWWEHGFVPNSSVLCYNVQAKVSEEILCQYWYHSAKCVSFFVFKVTKSTAFAIYIISVQDNLQNLSLSRILRELKRLSGKNTSCHQAIKPWETFKRTAKRKKWIEKQILMSFFRNNIVIPG